MTFIEIFATLHNRPVGCSDGEMRSHHEQCESRVYTAILAFACAASCHQPVQYAEEGWRPRSCAQEFDTNITPVTTKTTATRDTTVRAGEVDGRVVWAEGGGAAGLTIISATGDSFSGEHSKATDDEGRFHLDHLPIGRVLLQARRIGLHTDTLTIDTHDGTVVQFALHEVCNPT